MLFVEESNLIDLPLADNGVEAMLSSTYVNKCRARSLVVLAPIR